MCIRDRAIGAAALFGPVGLIFAGFAVTDIGRSVAKWLSRTFGAVSYTHLDVYKRQVLPRAICLSGLKKNPYVTNSTCDIKILLSETDERCRNFLSNALPGLNSMP